MPGEARKFDVRVLICIAAVALFASALLSMPSAPVSANPEPAPLPTPRKARYNEFPHSTKAHKLDCGTCHKFPSSNWKKVRAESAAFPDIAEYPSHNSCIKCHTQQFFRGSPPAICSICHTNPGPRNSARHPFPNPREIFDKSPKGKTAESDFAVGFPHDKHIEIVTAHRSGGTRFIDAAFEQNRSAAAEESCAVCHQTMMPQGDSAEEYITKPPANLDDAFWLKKGMFKSSPIGHTTCFTCHNAESGTLPEPKNCAACHQLKSPQPPADVDPKFVLLTGVTDKVMLNAWRKRDSSGTFRHEFFAHVELSCSTCHNVFTINTADPATKKVPIAACAACHATPSSDDGGAINFEVDSRKTDPSYQCIKCHTTFGKLPIPESHKKAITAAAGK